MCDELFIVKCIDLKFKNVCSEGMAIGEPEEQSPKADSIYTGYTLYPAMYWQRLSLSSIRLVRTITVDILHNILLVGSDPKIGYTIPLTL